MKRSPSLMMLVAAALAMGLLAVPAVAQEDDSGTDGYPPRVDEEDVVVEDAVITDEEEPVEVEEIVVEEEEAEEAEAAVGLAVTGATLTAFVAVALVLLALGALLVGAARRRRVSTSGEQQDRAGPRVP